MKLKFIGRGGAFAPIEIGQSNMVFISDNGKILLLDCGTTAPYKLHEFGIESKDIDAVYISHTHADHIGGLEWLGFTTYFNGHCKRPTLYAEKKLVEDLWENSLKGGMKYLQGINATLESYFDCRPIDMDAKEKPALFEWEGYSFKLIKTLHVEGKDGKLYSYGLMAWNSSNNGKKIYITTDSQYKTPSTLEDAYKLADIIFHDCETSKNKSLVHSNYYDMRETMDADVRKKVYLYHYSDPIKTVKEDGFAGFINTGDEFEF
jgi:ribonuclease BN (tRNA processing enzyme)